MDSSPKSIEDGNSIAGMHGARRFVIRSGRLRRMQLITLWLASSLLE
ncbi:MAG: hypothetical protein AAF713_16880 [Pseudomonadota bacterium]